ncbi:MAG: hypothetical protein V3G42_10345, partial [Oscillospiraceae bacterium]
AGTKAMNLSVYSTERNPETGEIGKWLTASSGIREVEETDSGKIVNYPSVSNGGGADGFGKQGFVTFDYTGDSNILYFEVGMDGVGGGFYSYNMYTGEISNFQPTIANYDVPVAGKFDVPDGYESVTVYAQRPESNYGIADADTEHISMGFFSINFLADEWKKDDITLSVYFQGNFDKFLTVTFNYPNGGFINYKVIFEDVVAEDYNYRVNQYSLPTDRAVYDEEEIIDPYGEPVYEGTNSEGKPIVNNETLGVDTQKGDYTVTIYEGAIVYGVLDKAEFENGAYVIDKYNPDKNYYVKVGYDDNSGDYIMSRFNDKAGGWIKRVDTKRTPVYSDSVSLALFPDEFAEGTLRFNGSEVTGWDKEEFGTSAKNFNIVTRDSDKYDVEFRYPEGNHVYTFIGIDPELVSKGSENSPTTEIDTSANSGDELHISGETEDGTKVDFDYTIPDELDGDSTIKLPDGDYTVTDKTTGIKDDVSVDGDNDTGKAGSVGSDGTYNSNGENGEKKGDKATLNLTEPETISTYKITAPDGTVLDEDKLNDGVLDNLTDLEHFQKDHYWYAVSAL